MIVGLADLAAMPGVPSEPTLRKLIDENDDFPVLSRGKNGQAYEIDAEAALSWLKARREAEAEERQRKRSDLRQMALGILGDDAASIADDGLSAGEQKQLLEAEIAAIKLGELRGALVRKADVEVALGELAVWLRQTLRTLSQRLQKRVDVSREAMTALDGLVDADLNQLADRVMSLNVTLQDEPRADDGE